MDSTSVDKPVPEYTALLDGEVKNFVLGVPKQYFEHGMDKEVEQRVREAIETCGKLGADIIEVDLPHTEYAVAVYYIICTAEASTNLARFDGVRYGLRDFQAKDIDGMYCRTRSKGFGAEVKRRIMLGTYVLSSGYYEAYYLTATKVRTLIRRDFEKAFERCDALLAPVTPTPPYKIGEKIHDPLSLYLGDIFTVMANLAGICAISIPCGYTSAGLPVGFQILGPAFKEENILRAGFAYEQYVKQG
jgi:aspartyl-tRNA(Asn)/glutamyl-tRNA(Gln) amidotransferase subunit A